MASNSNLEMGGALKPAQRAAEARPDSVALSPQRGRRKNVAGATSANVTHEHAADKRTAERVAAAERRADERVAAAERQIAAERSARLEAVRRHYAEQASRQDAEARLAGQIASRAIAQRDADEAIEAQQAEHTARLVAESRLAGEIAGRIIRQRTTQDALERQQAKRAGRQANQSEPAKCENPASPYATDSGGQSGGGDKPRLFAGEAVPLPCADDGRTTTEHAAREAVAHQLAECTALLEASERQLAERSAQLETAHRQLAERTAQLEAAQRE